MKKTIFIITLILLLSCLGAQAILYPWQSIAENFGAEWCGACQFAIAGLENLNDALPAGEINIVRLLTQSGPYSPQQIEERFMYYEVMGLPAVIFNGKSRIDGSGEGIEDGSRYLQTMQEYRYLGTPLMMKPLSFDVPSGNVQVQYRLLDAGLSLPGAELFFYLVEDEIADNLDRIVRDIIVQPLDLEYSAELITASASFDIDPAYNPQKLWALAFVQLDDGTIIQSASSRPGATHRVQAALSFDNQIFGEDNTLYESPYFYVYNMGESAQFTRQIEVVSAPDDWYLNYCGEDGDCYPGSIPIPVDISAGAYAGFKLNLMIGSPGAADFNFVISSPDLGEYKIPFRYTVGTSNQDLIAPAQLRVVNSYPNPLVNKVSFELSNPHQGLNSELEIYNIKGQKLQSLPLRNLEQGSHQLEMDLGALPSGVYFYRLQGSSSGAKLLKIK